jgi:translation initiation factor 4E
METQQQITVMAETEATTNKKDDIHILSDKWTLWAHLPHNTDWSIKSYIPIYTFTSVEETIAITETIPSVLIENCMLFLMKEGIKPTWEDPQNRNGGCFSYKIANKNVAKIWKELTYVTVGGTISNRNNYVNKVTGITISPKKNFCIIKIWMSDCSNQDPEVVTNELKGLVSQGCLFKKHAPEY